MLLAWGKPVDTAPIEGGMTWYYPNRMLERRYVVFFEGVVSKVYPPGGY